MRTEESKIINVLLLGATGTAGSALAKRLAENPDCHVTLFARHTNTIRTDAPNVTVISGDAVKTEELTAAVQGQDVVYSAISGEQLPVIAKNLVTVMSACKVERLIFMGAVGIYNEIPKETGGEQYNVDSEPEQVPNRQAVDSIEASDLNYTILRPGFLQNGDEDDYVLTVKGEPAKGYVTTLPSVVKLAVELIYDENLYSRESVGITRDMLVEVALGI